MPNSYQSPQLNKQGNSNSTTTSSTSVRSTTVVQQQHHQQQHQQIKPSIVETPATPQPQVPPEDEIPHNIVFNNVSAFTSMSRRNHEEDSHQGTQSGSRVNRLSKCDSWNQICQLQQTAGPSPAKYNQPGSPGELRRTKSGHSLAVPKLYEAGIDKAQVSEKQRTVAAYFSGQKSPTGGQVEELRTSMTTTTSSRKSAINRTKTSEKLSAAARKSLSSLTTTSNGNVSTAGLGMVVRGGGVGGIGGGAALSRSATMPHIANLNLLDESNVEDAFEQLMMGA
nr:GH02414p [Drosophila melanogaster]